MTVGSAGAVGAFITSVLAAIAYCLLERFGRRGALTSGARAAALLALLVAAALGAEGWLLAVAVGLFCIAEVVVRQWAAALDPGVLASGQALALLALAAEAALALRAGGGIALMRTEPLRLAGLLAATSLAVLAVRRGPLRFAARGSEGLVAVGAVFVVAATTLALPLHRWPAMAGGLVMLFALTPLGSKTPRPRTAARGAAAGHSGALESAPQIGLGLAPTCLFYLGQALFAAAFIPALARPASGL